MSSQSFLLSAAVKGVHLPTGRQTCISQVLSLMFVYPCDVCECEPVFTVVGIYKLRQLLVVGLLHSGVCGIELRSAVFKG